MSLEPRLSVKLQERLTDRLNDVLRTAGYVFELVGNNRKQSNIVTGPNNYLIPTPVTAQLTSSIAGFDLALDDVVSQLNDAVWCVERIVENRQKQQEMRMEEELERQKRAEAERKRKEDDERRREEVRREEQRREEERREEEKRRKEQEAKEKEKREGAAKERQRKEQDSGLDGFATDFDFDMDLSKAELNIPNPLDILSSIPYKGGEKAPEVNIDLDLNVLNLGQSILDDLNMDLLNQDFDTGAAPDEDFDVDNFLNQFGNGD